jgi:hypothetical protein
VRLRGALLWAADGEARRDEVVVSDERPNGEASHVVILDEQGRRRAASPEELPSGSVLLLPSDASDQDIDRIQESGYPAYRDGDLEDADEGREAAIRAADEELEEVIERLTREVRQKHPEFFDADGNFVWERVSQKLLERTNGKQFLTDEELFALTDPQIKAWTRRKSVDAP